MLDPPRLIRDLDGTVPQRSCSPSKNIPAQSTSGASAACLQRCSAESRSFRVEIVSCGSRTTSLARRLDACFATRDHHQLSIILDILGTPSIDDFYAITSQRSREYLRALPFRKQKPFSQLFPEANPLVRPSSLFIALVQAHTNSAGHRLDGEMPHIQSEEAHRRFGSPEASIPRSTSTCLSSTPYAQRLNHAPTNALERIGIVIP